MLPAGAASLTGSVTARLNYLPPKRLTQFLPRPLLLITTLQTPDSILFLIYNFHDESCQLHVLITERSDPFEDVLNTPGHHMKDPTQLAHGS